MTIFFNVPPFPQVILILVADYVWDAALCSLESQKRQFRVSPCYRFSFIHKKPTIIDLSSVHLAQRSVLVGRLKA